MLAPFPMLSVCKSHSVDVLPERVLCVVQGAAAPEAVTFGMLNKSLGWMCLENRECHFHTPLGRKDLVGGTSVFFRRLFAACVAAAVSAVQIHSLYFLLRKSC